MEIRSNPAALSAYAGQVKNQQQNQNRFQVQSGDEGEKESSAPVAASVQEQLKASAPTAQAPSKPAPTDNRREAPFGVDSAKPQNTRPGQILDISV